MTNPDRKTGSPAIEVLPIKTFDKAVRLGDPLLEEKWNSFYEKLDPFSVQQTLIAIINDPSFNKAVSLRALAALFCNQSTNFSFLSARGHVPQGKATSVQMLSEEGLVFASKHLPKLAAYEISLSPVEEISPVLNNYYSVAGRIIQRYTSYKLDRNFENLVKDIVSLSRPHDSCYYSENLLSCYLTFTQYPFTSTKYGDIVQAGLKEIIEDTPTTAEPKQVRQILEGLGKILSSLLNQPKAEDRALEMCDFLFRQKSRFAYDKPTIPTPSQIDVFNILDDEQKIKAFLESEILPFEVNVYCLDVNYTIKFTDMITSLKERCPKLHDLFGAGLEKKLAEIKTYQDKIEQIRKKQADAIGKTSPIDELLSVFR